MPGDRATTVPHEGKEVTSVEAGVMAGPGHEGSTAVPAAATVQDGFTVPVVGQVPAADASPSWSASLRPEP